MCTQNHRSTPCRTGLDPLSQRPVMWRICLQPCICPLPAARTAAASGRSRRPEPSGRDTEGSPSASADPHHRFFVEFLFTSGQSCHDRSSKGLAFWPQYSQSAGYSAQDLRWTEEQFKLINDLKLEAGVWNKFDVSTPEWRVAKFIARPGSRRYLRSPAAPVYHLQSLESSAWSTGFLLPKPRQN